MSLAAKGPSESTFRLPRAARNRGDSLVAALILAPGEEATHGAGVGASGMGIGDPDAKELISSE